MKDVIDGLAVNDLKFHGDKYKNLMYKFIIVVILLDLSCKILNHTLSKSAEKSLISPTVYVLFKNYNLSRKSQDLRFLYETLKVGIRDWIEQIKEPTTNPIILDSENPNQNLMVIFETLINIPLIKELFDCFK
jgi:hypothetical protein